MKKLRFLIFALAIAILASACGRKEFDKNSAVVYEMNIRQYTPEGTFAAARAQLPRLKELGVDILWLMPIHPIGVEGRKGELGSYYAPKDYKAVNPEFGTMEDFDAFLASAHKLGLKVVLDMVCNHSSPDAVWNTPENYDWYVRDSLGNTIVEYDWTDIAKLNYESKEMRAAMDDALKFWIKKGVDGYRCDAAWSIPTDYWENILPQLRAMNPDIYLLAEAEKPELHNFDGGFEVAYAWNLHHTMNEIAQGKAGVKELEAAIDKYLTEFPKSVSMLAFTSNHDENSWAGTEFERMGDAWKAMAVLCYTLPKCQPLIYTGQEVGWDKRFEFFKKDLSPDWTENEYTGFYKQMNRLYHDNPALHSGEKGGEFEVVSDEDETFVFTRTLGADKLSVSVQLKSPWTYSISASPAL